MSSPTVRGQQAIRGGGYGVTGGRLTAVNAAFVVSCIALAVACFAAVTAWQSFLTGVRIDRALRHRREHLDREAQR